MAKKKMDELVGYHLGMAAHLIQNHYNKKLAEHGLTAAQSRVLYILNQHEKLMQAELQKRLYIQASTMNGIIDTLLKKELITKDDSKEDRRSKVISITAAGQYLEEKLSNEVYEIEESLLKGFSPEEQQLFLSWIKRMRENLQDMKISAR
ncbi:MarR family winged helix-turn-helix transcriptional regulator [Evansella clarkii]|jgi:DNA-binding MarR family transcriptional regulator|uniref:MarR family winged helix-turn-helix transcriptional regulator n=1 Tax=Evansella clarkii TaxID=79879 RepID=UPI000996620F|nr:MarR family transcriptional regulator [Evansella clarkii]